MSEAVAFFSDCGRFLLQISKAGEPIKWRTVRRLTPFGVYLPTYQGHVMQVAAGTVMHITVE